MDLSAQSSMDLSDGKPHLVAETLSKFLGFSKRQEDCLIEVWAVLEPEMECIGVEIFQRILQLCPEAIRMFYFGQNVTSVQDIMRNREFRYHCNRFMEVIKHTVSSVRLDVEVSKEYLQHLGQLHHKIRNRGFRPQYWTIFKTCLIDTIDSRVQNAYVGQFDDDGELCEPRLEETANGPNVDEIWESVTDYIINQMRIGFNNPNANPGDSAL